MEVILALVFILGAGTLVLGAAAFVFAAAYVGAIMFVFYVLPRLLFHIAAFALHAAGVALFALLFVLRRAIRELTGHAARGVATWDAQPQWQQQAQERARQEASVPVVNSWEAACTLLGLPVEGFGKPELSRAYREAIITAHPDVGGNPALAKALNVARDLIRKQQGWA